MCSGDASLRDAANSLLLIGIYERRSEKSTLALAKKKKRRKLDSIVERGGSMHNTYVVYPRQLGPGRISPDVTLEVDVVAFLDVLGT